MTTTADSPATTADAPVVPPTRAGDVGRTAKLYETIGNLEQTITLDPTLRELVKLRASTLNGCSFCVDMHTTDGRAHGETDRRLATAGTWRHAPFFTARERAALALTDEVTLMGEHGVSDAVWDEAKAHFSPDELGNLLFAIIAINSWNRLAVTLLSPLPD